MENFFEIFSAELSSAEYDNFSWIKKINFQRCNNKVKKFWLYTGFGSHT